MSEFGPAAAAAAYIAEIPAAERAAAAANTAWDEWSFTLQLAILLALCAVLLRTRLLARVRSGCEGRGLSRWTADLACAGLFAALVVLALSPVHVAYGTRAEPGSSWPAHLLEALRSGAPLILFAALTAPVGLFLIRRAPKAWGALCGGALAALAFAAVWLPYWAASGPAALPAAPPGPAREGLLRLIRDTRTPASQVYVSGAAGVDADVTGSPGHARVVVSHGLWTRASPPELRASIGHLIGHYRHGDQLSLAIVLAALILASFLGVQLLAPGLARRMRLQGPGDPAALPLLAALFAVFACLGVAIDHGFIRAINVRADQFSLDSAQEPDGLALALLHEWKGERVDPSPVEEALFYDHPSLKSRLLHAMRWKAAHQG